MTIWLLTVFLWFGSVHDDRPFVISGQVFSSPSACEQEGQRIEMHAIGNGAWKFSHICTPVARDG
jgi:hypothetical protein